MFLQGTWAWRVKIGQIEQKPRRRGGDVAFSVLWVPQIKIPSTHWDRRWMGIPSGVPGDLPISALWGLLFLLSSVPLPSACCPAGETAQRPVSLSICSLALWFLDWCAPWDQQAPRSGEFDWSVCYTKAGNVDGERISLMHRKLSVCLLGNGSWLEKVGCLLWRPPLQGSRLNRVCPYLREAEKEYGSPHKLGLNIS